MHTVIPFESSEEVSKDGKRRAALQSWNKFRNWNDKCNNRWTHLSCAEVGKSLGLAVRKAGVYPGPRLLDHWRETPGPNRTRNLLVVTMTTAPPCCPSNPPNDRHNWNIMITITYEKYKSHQVQKFTVIILHGHTAYLYKATRKYRPSFVVSYREKLFLHFHVTFSVTSSSMVSPHEGN